MENGDEEQPPKKRRRQMSAYELFKIDFRAEQRENRGEKIDVRDTTINIAAREAWTKLTAGNPEKHTYYLKQSDASKGEAAYHKLMERRLKSQQLALDDAGPAGTGAQQLQLALPGPSSTIGVGAIVPAAAGSAAVLRQTDRQTRHRQTDHTRQTEQNRTDRQTDRQTTDRQID